MDKLLTLQNIKDNYYTDLALTMEARGFEEYLHNYIKVYDKQLNFIGWILK